MLRIGLWLAGACAVVLALAAITHTVRLTSGKATPLPPPPPAAQPAKPAPSVEQAAQPAVAKAEAPRPAKPKPVLDPQVAEDAAAVGMTTREPAQEPHEPVDKPPQPAA